MAWEVKKLGDVCVFENGDRGKNYPSRSKYVDEGIPFVNAGHLDNNGINTRKLNYISKRNYDLLSRGKFKEGDILFCLRGTLGKFGIVQNGLYGAIASSLVIVRTKNDVLKEFLVYYFLSSTCKQMIEDLKGGTAQPNLGAKDLFNFKISVPPLLVQKQIVSILDEAFEKILKAKENSERNLKNAKDVFEGYLESVFENKGEGWEERKLGQITTKIGSGATPRGGKKSYKTEGISLVRSMNVHDRKFKEKNLAFIDKNQAKDLSNVTLQNEDVLLNITGASVARCCVLPKKYLPARVNQHVSIIRPKSDVMHSQFLNLLLTSKNYKDQLLNIGEQGATRQAITKVQLQNFLIRLPSLKEQKKIIDKSTLFSEKTNKLESIYTQKLSSLEELKKSILQKAFNGELTEVSA